MNWLLWSTVGTGAWLLLKKPASASTPVLKQLQADMSKFPVNLFT